MAGSISLDTLNTYAGSFIAPSGTAPHSVDSWSIVTAAGTTLPGTSDADPAGQASTGAHARLRSHLPDTSADLTRNWLTTTAPPPFSRKGVAEVVMPIKATRSPDDAPSQRERAQSTTRAEQEEGRRKVHGRHRHAVSQLQSKGSMRVHRSEDERKSEASPSEERTLGWVTLKRGMSISSSRRRPGLRERKNNGNIHEDDGGRGTNDGKLGLGGADEGECVEGRKLRRKWPWDSFLKIADKRLEKDRL